MEHSTSGWIPTVTLEESILLMALEESLNNRNTHASETAIAQQLTQEYAAHSESVPYSALPNGDSLPTIVEEEEVNGDCLPTIVEEEEVNGDCLPTIVYQQSWRRR